MSSLLITNGRVIDPAGAVDEVQDVLLTDGVVTRLGRDLKAPGARVVDARHRVVCPGFIDIHVHLPRAASPPSPPWTTPAP